MRIVITGSPGTGKSTIAKLLSQHLGIRLIGLKKVVLEKKLVQKNREVDIPRLKLATLPLLRKKGYVVEGHLACEFRIPADFVFVLRANPKTLRARLAKRRYGKKKLDENIMGEMLDYCSIRVRNEYGKPGLEIDTGIRGIPECVAEIEKAIKRKKKKLDSVDYSDELKKQLRLR